MRIEDGKVRKLPRFRIRGVSGTVTTDEAEVLDLSLGGALVEHHGVLRVGGICFLDLLPSSTEAITIRCRVVYSRVTGRESDRVLYCQTGLEFLDVTREIERVLGAIIRSYGAGKNNFESVGR